MPAGLLANPYPDLGSLGEVAGKNPRHLALEPTSVCNTKCTHCGHFYVNEGQHMKEEVFTIIRENLLDDAKSVDLTGWGEPLIARNFSAMFDECVKREMALSFTSNGIKLRTDELVQKLLRSDLLLRLSVDGATRETFMFVRPYIKWDDMLKTLECIQRNVVALGSEKRARLMIHFVAMKQNIQDLPEMVRMAAKYRFDLVKVLPLGLADLMERVKDQSLDGETALIERPVIEAMKAAATLGVALDLPSSFRDAIIHRSSADDGGKRGLAARAASRARLGAAWLRRMRFQRGLQVLLHGFGPRAKVGRTWCSLPWTQTHINADGTVYPCCRLQLKLGDLTKESWSSIWNGSAYRNLRRTIHSWNPTKVCRECHIPIGITGGDEHYHRRFFGQFRREQVGLDAPGVEFDAGFYPLERTPEGSPSHRWMGKSGVLELPARPGALYLRLGIVPEMPESRDSERRFRDNQRAAPEPFDNSCDEVFFPLNGVEGSTIRLRIEMEQTHRAGEDPRDLGVAISSIAYLFEPLRNGTNGHGNGNGH